MKVRISDTPLQIQEVLIKGYRSMTTYTFFSTVNKIVKWGRLRITKEAAMGKLCWLWLELHELLISKWMFRPLRPSRLLCPLHLPRPLYLISYLSNVHHMNWARIVPWVLILFAYMFVNAGFSMEPQAPAQKLKGYGRTQTQAVTFSAPFPPEIAFSHTFEGAIGKKYAFVMHLDKVDDNLAGTYRYQSQERDIRLKGKIDREGNFWLEEFVGETKTGLFVGTFLSANKMHGLWYKDGNMNNRPLLFSGSCRTDSHTEDEDKVLRVIQNLQFCQRTFSKGKEGFCIDLLNSFRANRIEFVQPFLRTDAWDNPLLQKYLTQCPDLHLNEATWFDRSREYHTYAHFGFRLYYVDIDQNPANGNEYVFYAGGYYNPKNYDRGGDHDRYIVVDFGKCRLLAQKPVQPAITYPSRREKDNFSGIVQYHGKSYIYEVHKLPDGYTMYVMGWADNSTSLERLPPLCSYLPGEK